MNYTKFIIGFIIAQLLQLYIYKRMRIYEKFN